MKTPIRTFFVASNASPELPLEPKAKQHSPEIDASNEGRREEDAGQTTDAFIRVTGEECNHIWTSWPAIQEASLARGTILVFDVFPSVGNLFIILHLVVKVRMRSTKGDCTAVIRDSKYGLRCPFKVTAPTLRYGARCHGFYELASMGLVSKTSCCFVWCLSPDVSGLGVIVPHLCCDR